MIIPAADVVYARGQFGTIAGEPHRGLALLDAISGKSTGWDAAADDNIYALALAGDALYVAGDFETIGGKSRKGLAALDAGSGTATRWDASPDEAVRALAVSPGGGHLVAAGDFTKIAGGRRELGELISRRASSRSGAPTRPSTAPPWRTRPTECCCTPAAKARSRSIAEARLRLS